MKNKTIKICGIGAVALFVMMVLAPAVTAMPHGGYPPYMEWPETSPQKSDDGDYILPALTKIGEAIRDGVIRVYEFFRDHEYCTEYCGKCGEERRASE